MLTAAALALLGLAPGGDAWSDHVLDNGVRVTVVCAPDAPRQAFFTLLPFGLLSDRPDEAQFAHLLEHLLIRSTDPDALVVDEVLLNGETTGTLLRLESIAPAARWRAALERHAAWLDVAGEGVEAEVLEREKGRIAGEEEHTVANGFTGKWALAAWNQVVRHGRPHAAVNGDVQAADADALSRRLAERVPIGPEVLVVAVGPVAAEDVLDVLGSTVGRLAPRAVAVAPAAKDVARADTAATWDLDAWHRVEWFPLGDDAPADRLSAAVLEHVVQARLASDGALRSHAPSCVVVERRAAPEGPFLLLAGGARDAEGLAEVEAGFERLLDASAAGGAGYPSLETLAGQVLAQFAAVPDLRRLRKGFGARAGAEFLEAQVVLNRVMLRERAAFRDEASFAAAVDAFDAARVVELAEEVLDPSRRGTLTLRPRGEDE